MATIKSKEASNLKQLRIVLNQTGTSLKNNPLYQFCNSLLDRLDRNQEIVSNQIAELKKQIDKISIPTPTEPTESKPNHIVLTDGGVPSQPIDDGFGSTITIEYEP